MTTFDKREEGFEKKFAHDEELRFKANARRNKRLGMWAAEKMGVTGPAAEAYAARDRGSRTRCLSTGRRAVAAARLRPVGDHGGLL